ncbi:MAG: hypothetical protein K1X72_27775 [Pyrinomonadaceae bacterium]|nr:hypothetical protein [Pyrinomonadaceae bacterium]
MFDFSKDLKFSEEKIDEIFQQFLFSFSDAAKTFGEPADFYFQTANQIIHLKFAGKNLAQSLTRALLHLQTEPTSKPDFTICIWDSKSTQKNLPPFLDQFNQFVNSHQNSGLKATRGDIPILTNQKIRTALMGNSALTMANFQQRICVHWISDEAKIPYFDIGAPLRLPFTFMFGNASRQLLHGGAVGNEDGGVFLGGIGGSGKSTTALNCLNSPLKYASDDYVLVDLEPKPIACSLYNTAKLKTLNDLERFPDFRAHLSNEEGVKNNREKPMIFLNEHFPQKLMVKIPLRAIVFPKFTAGAKINYQTMPKQRAFREIATSTIRQTPNDDQTALGMIGKFIKELPCYELIFGENQSDLPKYIAEIIARNS